MEGNKISRLQLNKALKTLPVPVQEHAKRCKLIANYLVDRIRLEDWFLDSGLNADHIVSAVFYHDLGKTRVARDYLYAESNVSAAKKNAYRAHVQEGIRAIEEICGVDFSKCTARSFESYVYYAITEHHERADGCGFPAGIGGKNQSVVGQIAAIADVLDNLLFVGNTESVSAASALTALENMAGHELDAYLCSVLLSDRQAFVGFIEYIDTRNQAKRKKDQYGLQLMFMEIQNMPETRVVDYYVHYVINDPFYGILRPEVFMPVAEKASQVLRLGKLVLERTCMAVDRVAERYGVYPRVCVSVSAKCLESKSFLPEAIKLLQKYQIKPRSICLIFDGCMPDEGLDFFAAQLVQLREAGYRLAVSGMGDGSELFGAFDRISVDSLFIDAGYTRRIVTNPNTYGVASGILDIAHNLHMRAIFMGVDERKIEGELMKMTARYGCGLLYGDAKREHEFIALFGGDD